MASRSDIQRLTLEFAEGLSATHFTAATTISLAAPMSVYQIQIDTTQSEPTSWELSDGADVIKFAALPGIGTREITWLGRPYNFSTNLLLTRKDALSDATHFSIIYRPT